MLITEGDPWSSKWGSCVSKGITYEGSDAVWEEGEAQP
jgi:hypothetical protein